MRQILIFLTSVLIFAGIATVVLAQGGLEEAGKVSGLKETAVSKTGGIPEAVGLVLEQALIYLGILFFLLIVYAGFLWMTASGNDNKVEKAKGILIAAVTGLVIIVSAYALVNFVFSNILTIGPEITNKCQVVEPYVFANCQPAGTNCEYQGVPGKYEKNLCPGGEDIQCCRVTKGAGD